MLTVPTTSQVLRTDAQESNGRFRFIFTDTTKGVEPEKRQVLVRDRDGTLRTAVLDEWLSAMKLNFPKLFEPAVETVVDYVPVRSTS